MFRGKTERRLVPRWRSSETAARSTEFVSLKRPPVVRARPDDRAIDAMLAFEREPSVGSAAEVLSASVFAGSAADAAAAAQFVIDNTEIAPHSLVELARVAAGPSDEVDARAALPMSSVARTRALLRISPTSAALWSDMARHYASQGNARQASRCMTTALALAPNHRWMLRTAARFFVHQKKSATAHKLLANHPRTRSDPWLMAAELACAQVAGRPPKFWRQANDILRFDRFSPVHVSELATAVGMMELESGERKKARKLVHRGLTDPTENALAQVCWATEQRHLDESPNIGELVKSTRDAYEADFKLNVQKGELLAALESGRQWKEDEPFSARPMAEMAFVSSLLDAHDLTIEMADQVQRLDGAVDDNVELNRMFAVLSSNRLSPTADGTEIERAKQRLMHLIERSEQRSYHALANLGLWHYRFGAPMQGREIYRLAIDAARKLHNTEAAAFAAAFAAREAVLAGQPESAEDLALARSLSEKTKSKACAFYVRKLEALAAAPDQASVILSPKYAPRLLDAVDKKREIKVTKTKAGLVITLIN